MGSDNRKSRGLGWETADQWKKGIAGSGNRKSRDLEGETAGEGKKGSRTQGEGKPLEKRGRKVQSPILGTGVGIKG